MYVTFFTNPCKNGYFKLNSPVCKFFHSSCGQNCARIWKTIYFTFPKLHTLFSYLIHFWNYWLLNTLTPCKISFGQILFSCFKLWNTAQKLKTMLQNLIIFSFLQECDVKVLNLLKSISLFNIMQKVTYVTQNFWNSRIFLVTVCLFVCFVCHKKCSIIRSTHKDWP